MERLIQLRFVSAPDDPEKLVLPGLVYCSPSHPKFNEPRAGGFTLSLGWWHWCLRFKWLTYQRVNP